MASAQQISSVSSLHADAELAVAAASCVPSTALQAGMRAPLFSLAGADGRQVALEGLLDAGPVVLHFFRGAWCADGVRSLREFAAVAPSLAALGASAVAIGPGGTPPAPALATLQDTDMRIARSYGLAFNLPYSLRPQYRRLGYRPPDAKDDAGDWLVPVPAVYLLDRDGIIVLASVERDYRKRFDAAPLLGALKAISPIKRKYRA